MIETKIFTGSTLNEVAKAFSEVVREDYLKSLRFWQAYVIDDAREYALAEQKIRDNPKVIQGCAYNRIQSIMHNPQMYEQFYKKIGPFRSRNTILITAHGGFYHDICDDDTCEEAFALNVVYVIDKRKLSITEKNYAREEMKKIPK